MQFGLEPDRLDPAPEIQFLNYGNKDGHRYELGRWGHRGHVLGRKYSLV
jgi:hypothetical protein